MNITNELREIQKMSKETKDLKKKIDRIFSALKGYSEQDVHEAHEEINCISVALILSRITAKGLSKRTNDFLDQHGYNLPEKAVEILRKNALHMEVY